MDAESAAAASEAAAAEAAEAQQQLRGHLEAAEGHCRDLAAQLISRASPEEVAAPLPPLPQPLPMQPARRAPAPCPACAEEYQVYIPSEPAVIRACRAHNRLLGGAGFRKYTGSTNISQDAIEENLPLRYMATPLMTAVVACSNCQGGGECERGTWPPAPAPAPLLAVKSPGPGSMNPKP